MNRAIRTRLADLFLSAFAEPAKRDTVLWLALYCELSTERRAPLVPTADLEAAWADRYHGAAPPARAFEPDLAGLDGVLELRRLDGGSEPTGVPSRRREGVRVGAEAHPDLLPFLAAGCDRLRTYAQVVRQVALQEEALEQMEPLRRAVAEAALCFNAGLFFEAHEHLERHWVGLPPGAARRFLQGVIQISVGFHHALRGSYEGAVNQLEKGLAKLAGPEGDTLGLDCARFRHEVTAARQGIVARGRHGMRRAVLDELPRMHLGR